MGTAALTAFVGVSWVHGDAQPGGNAPPEARPVGVTGRSLHLLRKSFRRWVAG
jgi:hypothetical protein